MKLIKLDEKTSVNSDEITEVTVSYTSNVVTVRVRSGIGYKVLADYGKSITHTYDRLVAEINAAMGSTCNG